MANRFHPDYAEALTRTFNEHNINHQLIEAIEDYNTDKVIELLEEGANPNYRTEDGDTPLFVATRRGGDEEGGDEEGGDEVEGVKIVKALLDRGANPNVEDEKGLSPLMHAIIEDNYYDMIKELLKQGADPNHQDKNGWTALMLTAEGDNLNIVRELLDRGANPDLQNEDGMTALILASWRGWHLKDTIKELLDRGADRDLRDKYDRTAFDLLEMRIKPDRIKDLQRLFAPNPAIIDPKTGISNLAIIATTGPLDLLEDAIDSRPDFNLDHQDQDGNTALIYAIVNRKPERVNLLLDRGADPNLANNGGGTPLAYANALNQEQIIEALTEAGAK
jgi:ankyrin repeat protein